MHLMSGTTQNYAWGSSSEIPLVLGLPDIRCIAGFLLGRRSWDRSDPSLAGLRVTGRKVLAATRCRALRRSPQHE